MRNDEKGEEVKDTQKHPSSADRIAGGDRCIGGDPDVGR